MIKIKEEKKNPLKKVLGNNKVQVGIFGEGKNVMLMSIFEGQADPGGRNGSVVVPAWKPLETATPDMLEASKLIIKVEAADMILNGKDNALKKVALKCAEVLKETIEDTKTPGNKPKTIDMKGADNPMIDSGRFKKAISAKVNGVGTFGKGKLG